jgi:2,4-dienoyl-CoA reductase-like NADH-dependent reductase (Old Yellow Enzyme family)
MSTTLKQSFTPVRVGRYTLPNRLVVAPMTRNRAKYDGTPGDLAAEYYAQRASIGLIVTEGTQPSDDGQGYLATPGIYTPAHIAGWQKVTRAVHENDGHIFIQMIGQRRSGLQPHPSHSAGFAIADRARRGVHAVIRSRLQRYRSRSPRQFRTGAFRRQARQSYSRGCCQASHAVMPFWVGPKYRFYR